MIPVALSLPSGLGILGGRHPGYFRPKYPISNSIPLARFLAYGAGPKPVRLASVFVMRLLPLSHYLREGCSK